MEWDLTAVPFRLWLDAARGKGGKHCRRSAAISARADEECGSSRSARGQSECGGSISYLYQFWGPHLLPSSISAVLITKHCAFVNIDEDSSWYLSVKSWKSQKLKQQLIDCFTVRYRQLPAQSKSNRRRSLFCAVKKLSPRNFNAL